MMKMYNYYRLVILNDGSIPTIIPGTVMITNEDMDLYLHSINFTVPNIPRVPDMVYPVRPTLPQNTLEGQIAWKEYSVALMAAKKVVDDNLAAQTAAINAYAIALEKMFKIARYCVIGKTPQGRNILGYQIVAPVDTKYTYKQAASRLTGVNKPADPIEFIAHGQFG